MSTMCRRSAPYAAMCFARRTRMPASLRSMPMRPRPLPAIITAEAALAPGAPAVWPDNPGNEAFTFEAGDRAAVEAALARAPRVVRMHIPVNRVTANSMEPRGCLAYYDPAEER